jgi:hypothetical protein
VSWVPDNGNLVPWGARISCRRWLTLPWPFAHKRARPGTHHWVLGF